MKTETPEGPEQLLTQLTAYIAFKETKGDQNIMFLLVLLLHGGSCNTSVTSTGSDL
jgi:hypothetical protein